MNMEIFKSRPLAKKKAVTGILRVHVTVPEADLQSVVRETFTQAKRAGLPLRLAFTLRSLPATGSIQTVTADRLGARVANFS